MSNSLWGNVDDYIGILQGQAIADAYAVGGLKAKLRGSQEHIQALDEHVSVLKEGLNKVRVAMGGVIGNLQRWALDDIAIRALLREILQAIRLNAPNHPFLQPSVRDRIYGTAHRLKMEQIQNEQVKPGILELRQFAPNIAHQVALEVLVSGATLVLKELDPINKLVEIENQQLIYWERFESAADENPSLTDIPAINNMDKAYPDINHVEANRRYKRKHDPKDSIGKQDKAVAEIFGPLLGLKDSKKPQQGQ